MCMNDPSISSDQLKILLERVEDVILAPVDQ
jgi:hypothetical protein